LDALTVSEQPLEEPVLLAEQTTRQGLLCAGAVGQSAVVSSPHPEREGPNQDAVALLPAGPGAQVLAVADGVGGGPSGARAARLAVEALRGAIPPEGGSDDALRNAVLDGFERANEVVLAEGNGTATTLAVVTLEELRHPHGGLQGREDPQFSARTYHVGDSPIMVVGQRGRLKLRTVSHSPVGYAVEAGVIDQDEAMYHQDRHLVTNVIGSADMRIEVGSSAALAPRDTLLVASDGLFDNLYLEEIVERIRKGPLWAAAEGLYNQALRRMTDPDPGHPSKADDLTFILFRRLRPSSGRERA
jgi:protein phosphatase